MSPTHRTFLHAFAGACALLTLVGVVQAQVSTDANVPPATAQKQSREITRSEPSRWFVEDATPAQRLRTLRKEIGAALQEAQGACRKLPTAERAGCLREARATFQQDMAGAAGAVRAEAAGATR
jgi:hypothetical protein